MAKVKVFEKLVKLQDQGHKVKNYGMTWKVLSQGIHLWNMKVLSFAVHKLWPRLKILSMDDDDNDNDAGDMTIVLRTFVKANLRVY